MTTLGYQGNPPPSRRNRPKSNQNRPKSNQNRSRPVFAPPSSDLPPQLLSLSDDERSKVLALDPRVLRSLYDVLALPSDIRGRLIPLYYDGKRTFTHRDKVPRRGNSESTLAEGGFRWNRPSPMPAVSDYTIIEWAVRFRNRNWAVRTGTIPGLDGRCLVVADVDYPERLNVPEHDLFFMSPLFTRRQTKRGIHVFGYSETPIKSMTKPKWGEVKAEGQYVMLHPQHSERALPYLQNVWPDWFLDTLSPFDGNVRLTNIRGGGPREIPSAAVHAQGERVRQETPRQRNSGRAADRSSPFRRRGLSGSDPGVFSPARASENDGQKPPIAYEGARDLRLMGALMFLAGRVKAYRGDYDDISHKLLELNSRCVPPMPLNEVDHVARQVAKYSDDWKVTGHRPSWLDRQHKKGRRSGTVRKKRVRNRNRRIRRDRASGMRYRDLESKYKMARSRLDGICNRRPQRVPIDMTLDPSIAHLPPTSSTIRKMVQADREKGANYELLRKKYNLTRYQLFIIVHHLPLPLVNPIQTERLRGLGHRILGWQSAEAESPAAPAEEPPSDPGAPP